MANEVVNTGVNGADGEMSSQGGSKVLPVIIILVTLVGVGAGMYLIYDNQRVKKINSTVVSVQDAKSIILNNSK